MKDFEAEPAEGQGQTFSGPSSWRTSYFPKAGSPGGTVDRQVRPGSTGAASLWADGLVIVGGTSPGVDGSKGVSSSTGQTVGPLYRGHGRSAQTARWTKARWRGRFTAGKELAERDWRANSGFLRPASGCAGFRTASPNAHAASGRRTRECGNQCSSATNFS